MKTEAKTGLMQPSETGRGKEKFSLRDFRWSTSLPTLDLTLLGHRTMIEYIPVVVSHQVLVICYSSARKLIQQLSSHIIHPGEVCDERLSCGGHSLQTAPLSLLMSPAGTPVPERRVVECSSY